jgi:heme A synthase
LLAYTSFDLLAKPFTKAQLTPQAVAAVKKIKAPAYLAGAIIALTAASGAFVAGNDAGHAYNDWPLMAGRFIPEEIWDSAMGVKNFFENTATVQFDHRMLAYSTLGSIGLLHAASKRAGGMRTMPAPVKKGLMVISGLVAAQITLGISTLMLYVPVSLGTAHQGGALALLTGALYLINGIRRVEREAVKLGVVASAPAAAATSSAMPTPAKASAAAVAAFAAMLSSSTMKELQEMKEDA